MGAKLTAGIVGGAFGVVVLSGVLAVQVLGSPSVGRGDVAAARFAQERSQDLARWLDPPDTERYSATQLVAAMLAARANGRQSIALALPSQASGTLEAVPVAWSGTTATTAGARVTVRIDADVAITSPRLFGADHRTDGHAARCFVYTMRTGDVFAVREIRCPHPDAAQKPPEPAALPTT